MKGAGGGKRGSRKPSRVETDDRPRGYEATRMRQLWRDIEDAKHKAGLGPAPSAEPTGGYGREMFGWLDRAATLVGDATTWLTSNAPAAIAILASGAELLRSVPVVGRIVDLVAVAEPPAREERAPHGHTNGAVRPMVIEPDDQNGPDGGWVH